MVRLRLNKFGAVGMNLIRKSSSLKYTRWGPPVSFFSDSDLIDRRCRGISASPNQPANLMLMSIRRATMMAGLCAVPFASLRAQEPTPTQSSRLATVGVLAGVSSTTLSGAVGGADLKRRVRPMFGAWILVNLKPRLQLEVDALYSAKGYKSPKSLLLTEFSTAYFEVPALLRYNFAPDARVQPFIGVGAAEGYRVGCSASTPKGEFAGGLGCDDVTSGQLLTVATTETSGVLGAGVDLLTKNAHFTFGARFTRGLTSVFEDVTSHNQAISLYLSIGKARQY